MGRPSAVFIARSDIASALRKRFEEDRDVQVFGDAEAITGLQTILKDPPGYFVLDPQFAATSRGATVTARVRSDAELAETTLHLLNLDDRARFMKLLQNSSNSLDKALASFSHPLDWCGTRRAPRFTIAADAPATVNGEPSRIVNLSASGIQIVSPGRLYPTQGFRLLLEGTTRDARLAAIVAWSTFEASEKKPTYRVGAQFVESDNAIIEDYCRQYGTISDRVFVVPADRQPLPVDE